MNGAPGTTPDEFYSVVIDWLTGDDMGFRIIDTQLEALQRVIDKLYADLRRRMPLLLAESEATRRTPPSEAEVLAARTPAGGWTKETFARWGIAWPPPSGWRADFRQCRRELGLPK